MRKNFHLFLAAASLLALVSCSTSQTYMPDQAPEMVITKDFAPFYRTGPQQINGPDASLRIDSYLKLLKKEFGFSYVQLEDGRTGFIPSDTYAPAPQRPTYSEIEKKPKTKSKPYTGPAVDDIPLPDLQALPDDIPTPILLDDEPSTQKPAFRL